MLKTTKPNRFLRTIIYAEFEPHDTVPILGARMRPFYSERVSDIERMGHFAKFWFHFWNALLIVLTCIVTTIGIAVCFDAETLRKIGVPYGLFFIFTVGLFLVQGFSIIGYYRWRYKKQRILL